MTNDGNSRNTNQVELCAATIPEVDMVPANRNTPTNDRAMAIS